MVQENPTETPFKGDNVKGLDKTSNCENSVLYFYEKVQTIAVFAMLFLVFSDQTVVWNGFGFPKWSEIPTLPASVKIKRHSSTGAAFGNSVFFQMENVVRWSALISSWQQIKLEIWCGWDHPYKTIAKFIVHSIYIKGSLNGVVGSVLGSVRRCCPIQWVWISPGAKYLQHLSAQLICYILVG